MDGQWRARDVHVSSTVVHSPTHITWTAAVTGTAAGGASGEAVAGHVRARSLMRLVSSVIWL